MSIIHIEDEFISLDRCLEIIQYYHNSDDTEKYGTTYPINITNKYSKFQDVFDKVIKTCLFLSNEKINLQRSEIVKWPVGSFMKPHYDPPCDALSCIIYLNDNYSGGRTCFHEDIKIKPKTGRSLIFSNSQYLHSVERIDNEPRYTMSFWFVY